MRPTDTACAGTSATASNCDQSAKPNVTGHETARWASFPKSEIVDALTAIRRIAIDTDELKEGRLSDGYLSAADIVVILRAYREFAALPFSVRSQPEADLNAFRLRAIREKLGPLPEHPFTEKTLAEAKATIDTEDRRKARVDALPKGMSVRDLLEKDFPPPAWIVENLLTTGVTVFAGAPKLGKSWMALGLGSAVGSGGAFLGRYRVERRRSLYLALEDVPRRLKGRLEKIGASPDSLLTIFTEWRSGGEGLADLDAWLYENPGTQLVLIDTLARFRGKPEQGESLYDYDYRITAAIKTLADKHDCAIALIHHVRKMASEDVMETVSGSNGLNGAADATWILTRARGEADATLFVTGRDIEEQSLALRFDPEIGTWTALGDAGEYTQSRERREVLDAVPLEPASRKTRDIVALVGKKPAAVSRLLEKLEADGLVFSPTYGEWSRRGGKSGNSVKPEPEVKPQYGTWEDLEGGKSSNSVNPSGEDATPPPPPEPETSQETFTFTPDLPPSPPPEEKEPEAAEAQEKAPPVPPLPEASSPGPEPATAREEPKAPTPKAKPARKPKAKKPRPPREATETEEVRGIKSRINRLLDELPDDSTKHEFLNHVFRFCKNRDTSIPDMMFTGSSGISKELWGALADARITIVSFLSLLSPDQQEHAKAEIRLSLRNAAIYYTREAAK